MTTSTCPHCGAKAEYYEWDDVTMRRKEHVCNIPKLAAQAAEIERLRERNERLKKDCEVCWALGYGNLMGEPR